LLEALENRTLPSFFGAAQFFATGSVPTSVAVGDFNHDGHLDLAVANFFGNTVSVLLGDGNGGFTTTSTVLAGDGPFSVAVGDFSHDGNLDLAVANANSNDVRVLLGDGKGGFAPASNFGVGLNPDLVAVGDFNHDGNLDLAVANSSDGTVSVLLGDGSGGFAPASTVPVGSFPFSMAVGDFNHDGNLDLAVANANGNTVSVAWNRLPEAIKTGTRHIPRLVLLSRVADDFRRIREQVDREGSVRRAGSHPRTLGALLSPARRLGPGAASAGRLHVHDCELADAVFRAQTDRAGVHWIGESEDDLHGAADFQGRLIPVQEELHVVKSIGGDCLIEDSQVVPACGATPADHPLARGLASAGILEIGRALVVKNEEAVAIVSSRGGAHAERGSEDYSAGQRGVQQ
jgi:hypothetical protein